MLNRRTLLATAAALTPLALPTGAFAQKKKDTLVIGLTLEPTGLDPTAKAGAEISEVVLYNIFETLTKINSDGSVTPLLADSWEVSPDLKTYTFKLKRGVKFQNGEPFNAQSVKFSFDRAAAANSTNKDKRTFANLATQAVDEHTVVLITRRSSPTCCSCSGRRRPSWWSPGRWRPTPPSRSAPAPTAWTTGPRARPSCWPGGTVTAMPMRRRSAR
jgi:peptide/nickel transport system substrate-binding protein